MFAGVPADGSQVLGGAIDQAAEAITEGRDAVQGLRTSAAETNDLADAIRVSLGDAGGRGRHPRVLRIEVRGTPRALHPIVRDELFRIAARRCGTPSATARQNRLRSSSATTSGPSAARARRRQGHRPACRGRRARRRTLRAVGMRERARVVGGTLTVWSGLGAGTEVEVSIPGAHAYSSAAPSPPSWLAQEVSAPSGSNDS